MLVLMLAPAMGLLATGTRTAVLTKPPAALRANTCMRSDEPQAGLKAQLGAAALAALLSTSPVTPFLDGAAFATISATSDPTLSQEAARAIVASKTKGAASTRAAVPLAPVEEPAADAAPSGPAPSRPTPAPAVPVLDETALDQVAIVSAA